MPRPDAKTTEGEKQRLLEKNKYKELARSQSLVQKGELLADCAGHYADGTDVPEETKKKVLDLSEKIKNANVSWERYTNAYLNIDSNATSDEALTEGRAGKEFIDEINSILRDFNAIQDEKLLENESFMNVRTFVTNLAGHYNEMTNGRLEVPQDLVDAPAEPDPELDFFDVNDSRGIIGLIERLGNDDNVVSVSRGFEMRDVPLFSHDISPNDPMQGMLGDCYLMSACSSVAASHPDYFRNNMRDLGNGKVAVRIYKEQRYREGVFSNNTNEGRAMERNYPYKDVILNKSVPVIKVKYKDGHEMRIDLFSKKALWVQMWEKAVAVGNVHSKGAANSVESRPGSYQSVESGHGEGAINMMFGRQHVRRELLDQIDITSVQKPDILFAKINIAVKDKHFVTTGTESDRKVDASLLAEYNRKVQELQALRPDAKKSTLEREAQHEVFCGVSMKKDASGKLKYSDHAYTVTRTFMDNGKKYIVVRNPHASADFDERKEDNRYTTQNANGYLTIPADKFAKMFTGTYSSMVTDPKYYVAPEKDVQNLSLGLYQGMKATRSAKSRLAGALGFDTLSTEFRGMLDASRAVAHLVAQDYPSETLLANAYERLAKASELYIAAKGADSQRDETHNKRLAFAKASLLVADAYRNRNTDACREKVRAAEIGLVTDRITYALNNQPGADLSVVHSDRYKEVVNSLSENDLLMAGTLATPAQMRTIMTAQAEALDRAKAAGNQADRNRENRVENRNANAAGAQVENRSARVAQPERKTDVRTV